MPFVLCIGPQFLQRRSLVCCREPVHEAMSQSRDWPRCSWAFHSCFVLPSAGKKCAFGVVSESQHVLQMRCREREVDEISLGFGLAKRRGKIIIYSADEARCLVVVHDCEDRSIMRFWILSM